MAQVAALLRSGAAPELAWSRGLGVGVRDGLPDPAALLGGAPEPHQAVAVLAAARLAQEVGAAPAVVLDGIVVSLVRDAQARSERSAALAGPRATASLLAWLPVVGLVLGVAVGADPLAVLLDGAGGSALLLAGVGASMVGRRWTALLLRRAARAGADR
ncbi:MAG TPA: type II secretion protein F [Actinotalea sp.]|nr:type II secretion protein F [Actinotalea sp.]